jgi:hypothetical protein
MRPYTSGTPWKCSKCKDYAKFKSEDGKFFYCEACARVVLRTNPEEAAAALLLGGQPKAAIEGHLKSGHSEKPRH